MLGNVVLNQIPEAFEAFSPQDSEDVLWSKIHSIFKECLGTTNILYGFTHTVNLADRVGFTKSLFIKHSHAADYVANFKDHNLLEDDICAAILFENLGPFLWDDLKNLPDLTEQQKYRSGIDDAYEMNVGVSLAFRFAGGRGISGIGLASRGMQPEEFAKRWKQDEVSCIKLLTAFDRLMRPAMISSRMKLTPRERECLSLSVAGMCAKEIGHHLGIAERSVFNILSRARQSLKSGNTIEAVAKALAYDLI